MKRNRRKHSPSFKAKVAMEELACEKAIVAPAIRSNVPLNRGLNIRYI